MAIASHEVTNCPIRQAHPEYTVQERDEFIHLIDDTNRMGTDQALQQTQDMIDLFCNGVSGFACEYYMSDCSPQAATQNVTSWWKRGQVVHPRISARNHPDIIL